MNLILFSFLLFWYLLYWSVGKHSEGAGAESWRLGTRQFPRLPGGSAENGGSFYRSLTSISGSLHRSLIISSNDRFSLSHNQRLTHTCTCPFCLRDFCFSHIFVDFLLYVLVLYVVEPLWPILLWSTESFILRNEWLRIIINNSIRAFIWSILFLS